LILHPKKGIYHMLQKWVKDKMNNLELIARTSISAALANLEYYYDLKPKLISWPKLMQTD